jgi:hypothetical protein
LQKFHGELVMLDPKPSGGSQQSSRQLDDVPFD